MCIVGAASEAESGALKIVFLTYCHFMLATSVRVRVCPNVW